MKFIASIILVLTLVFSASAHSQTKVVVVPLGGDAEKSEATLAVDGETSTVDSSDERYIIEATAAVVGIVQPLDHEIFLRLCQDKDGCQITLAMIDWDPTGRPGLPASQQDKLFYSEEQHTDGFWWRMATSDSSAKDNDGSIAAPMVEFDCRLTDAETSTNENNGRTDSTLGLGLLNVKGGSYNDTDTVCRAIIED